MLKVLKYLLIFVVCIVIIPVFITITTVIIRMMIERDEAYQTLLNKGFLADRQHFLTLTHPLFYFTRRHSRNSGVWVMVYPLDLKTKQTFLSRWKNGEAKTTPFIECIKPTIKKRWRTLHSNIHYVQPSNFYKDHRDYKRYGSFIVYGSEKQIKTVEQGCMETAFKIIPKQDNNSHYQYWAIEENQNLLFSINNLKP